MTHLEVLAVRSGIEAEFRDVRGNVRRTTPQTQHALLAAMGVQAGDEAQAAAALRALDDAAWAETLPPVCVVYAGARNIAIDLILPADSDEVRWVVALEGSGAMEGRAQFDALDLVERRDGLERRRLALREDIPLGYHRLSLRPGGANTVLIVSPGRCWLPAAIGDGRRLWGVAAQLYLLRSDSNWGIGDYGDLRRLVEMMGERGADVIGLNPLHAMFLDDPEHASPYSPASRLLLNVLNIDAASLPEMAACEAARALVASEAFQRQLAACRGAALVNYAGVAELKLQVLSTLFRCSVEAPDRERWRAFEAFRRERADVLERSCLFGAMREHFAGQPEGLADWHAWPAELRDPESDAVARFAVAHAERITFRIWLQWLADEQLAAAEAACSGMMLGLYRDLAVGADMSGAETWTDQAAVVDGAQVGAPPDIHNPAGQDWGLPPFHPRALRQQAYRSFVQLLRANMRHAGGLRIDHVMGLQHLYWVPRGKPAAEGAYVQYNLEDMIGILALESHRNKCIVVGEDLGTVPEGFRERMEAAGILSYRLLFFEQDDAGFLPPGAYPDLALAVAGSHDLPTLRGWWEGSDIDLRTRLGLFATEDGAELARQERARDRAMLVAALRREKLLDDDTALDSRLLILVAHAYLARSASALAMMQIDDMTDEREPVNVPSTSDEHPNWRRRLSLTLEELAAHPRLDELCAIFRRERS